MECALASRSRQLVVITASFRSWVLYWLDARSSSAHCGCPRPQGTGSDAKWYALAPRKIWRRRMEMRAARVRRLSSSSEALSAGDVRGALTQRAGGLRKGLLE